MIRVIDIHNPYTLKCKDCGRILEYEEEDVQTITTNNKFYYFYVECPICEEKNEVYNR